jgi:WD40 repeat protein
VWDEESGELHRELEDFGGYMVTALGCFLWADGQQPRLVAGSGRGHVRVYDPEAGLVLHRLDGHDDTIAGLACIASSSAAPHHPRLVSTCYDGAVQLCDGETGGLLADLRGHEGWVSSVAAWKEHGGMNDRIATAGHDGRVIVWDGETFAVLHDLDCGCPLGHILAFKSAEGPHRLPVMLEGRGVQVWDPEEGRLLHDGINQGSRFNHWHLFESAHGRHLLAIVGRGEQNPRDPGGNETVVLGVWDLGEAPAREAHVRGAHKHG